MALHLNWDENQNNGIIFNDTYTNGALFTGIENKPTLSFTFDSMQYTEVFPNQLNWIELSGVKRVMTASEESEVKVLATNWVQPVGQEGNPSFLQRVSAKLSELATSYNNANELDIAYMSTTFQADKKSQDLITGILAGGAVPSGFTWRDKLNADIPMTFTEFQGLSQAIVARGQGNWTKFQGLKAKVKLAKKQADLDLILW